MGHLLYVKSASESLTWPPEGYSPSYRPIAIRGLRHTAPVFADYPNGAAGSCFAIRGSMPHFVWQLDLTLNETNSLHS